MITINGKTYRNLEEQVLDNQVRIGNLEKAFYGRFYVVGSVSSDSELVDAISYCGSLGDCFINTTNNHVIMFIKNSSGAFAWQDLGAIIVAGPKGDTGSQGAEGPRGLTGPKGDTGARGAKGETGDKGEKGEPGVRGSDGAKGCKGDRGPKGETGSKGDKGDTGQQGIQGEPGKPFRIANIVATPSELPDASATQPNIAYIVGTTIDDYCVYAIINGVWTNIGKFNSIQGPKGDTGKEGPKGDTGNDGQDGAPGVSIESATIDAAGDLQLTFTDGHVENAGQTRGKDGKDGQNGKDGIDGKNGVDGQDGKPGTTDYNELQNKPNLDLKADKTYVDTELEKKQNKLIAGQNITIDESTSTISAEGGGMITEEVIEMDVNGDSHCHPTSTLKPGGIFITPYEGTWVQEDEINITHEKDDTGWDTCFIRKGRISTATPWVPSRVHLQYPQKITVYKVIGISGRAYAKSTGNITLKLPETIKTISDEAFQGTVQGLHSFTIYFPKSLDYIGARVFDTAFVDNLYYNGTIQEWNSKVTTHADWLGSVRSKNIVLHCKDGDIQLLGGTN